MITILHGDDEVKIQDELRKCIATAQKAGKDVIRLSAKGLTVPMLEQTVAGQSLFVADRLVVVEGLLSLPKSAQKTLLIEHLATYTRIDIVVVEMKIATPAQIKSLPQARPTVFKLPSLLFSWLEQLGVIPASQSIAQFRKIQETHDASYCFLLLVRQVRQLLQYHDGDRSFPSFIATKLARQASCLPLGRLLRLHQDLLWIDVRQKTSGSSLTLAQELEILIHGLSPSA